METRLGAKSRGKAVRIVMRSLNKQVFSYFSKWAYAVEDMKEN